MSSGTKERALIRTIHKAAIAIRLQVGNGSTSPVHFPHHPSILAGVQDGNVLIPANPNQA